ncbi:MAG: ankyrin repeat domain-containing protein [Endomicrobium sp.]|jgi:ankyrin repeat protein|nr:ankyrin repeat domain-containing protein [Endomicrobium sp.]
MVLGNLNSQAVGRTALMITAKNNSDTLVAKILLDANSDPNDQDFDRRTPLTHAAFNSYGKPKLLLECKNVCFKFPTALCPCY